MDTVKFLWVRVYAFCVIVAPEKLDSRHFYLALIDVKNQAVLSRYLHEVVQISVMLFLISAEYSNVVHDTQRAWALLDDHVHFLLENVL